MMKKIIQIFLAILFAIPVIAQQVDIVDVPNAPPGLVNVAINMTGGFNNVGSVTLNIELDENLLTYMNQYTLQTGLGGLFIASQSGSFLSIAWLSNNINPPVGNDINGHFVTLVFDYNGGFETSLDFIYNCEIEDVFGNPILSFESNPGAFLSGIVTPNFSNPAGSATIGELNAVAGGEVSVPLTLANINGFTGVVSSITLKIAYDNSKLLFNGVSNNGINYTWSGSNGIITLQRTAVPPLSGFPYVVNLNFTYLGGGQADLNFLPGSVVENSSGAALVTLFDNGYVDIDVTGPGQIKIAKVSSPEGQWVNLPDPPGGQQFVPVAVLVPVTVKDFSGIDVGAIELKIAYDDEKLDYTGFINGPLGNGWTVVQTAGYLQFSRIGQNGLNLPDDLVLFTLKFDYYEGTADITFEAGTVINRVNGVPIPVNLVDGWVASFITLNVKVFLQGFYLGGEEMQKAQELNGLILEDKFPGTVADRISVELHDVSNYVTIVWSMDNIDLNVNGTATLIVPSQYSGEYFLTIKHRNHLETVSAAPVDFGMDIVNYDFTDLATKAFGNNLFELVDGKFAIFAGDVDQDGDIDIDDVGPINSGILDGSKGYLLIDIDGDGDITIDDAGPVNTNILDGVSVAIP